MCICVNCRHMYKCTTYFFIQKQHKSLNYVSLHQEEFIPHDTIITIKINKKIKFDWDLVECLSFTEKPGQWLDDNPIF